MTKITLTTDKPDKGVIEELENALKLARAGHLRNVALIGYLKGGDHYNAFVCDDVFRLAGMLVHLQFRLLNAAPPVDTPE